MRSIILATLACGLLAGVPAMAQRKAPDPEKRFAKLDKNSDGKLSLEEYQAGGRKQADPEKRAKLFKKIDADGDGFVSKDEFLAAMKQRQPAAQ